MNVIRWGEIKLSRYCSEGDPFWCDMTEDIVRKQIDKDVVAEVCRMIEEVVGSQVREEMRGHLALAVDRRVDKL